MQRQDIIKGTSKHLERDSSFDVALARPGDDELFYTASVHFLKKRLQDKTDHVAPKETSQSCCNLTSIPAVTKHKPVKTSRTELVFDFPTDSSSLPMQTLLPFPKSNKESFFTRVKNTFCKYRQRVDMSNTNHADDSETKFISNFKFPRCERISKCPRSSCLVEISEENSNESMKCSCTKIVKNSSKGDVIQESKLNKRIFI